MPINFKSSLNLEEIADLSLKSETENLINQIKAGIEIAESGSIDEALELYCGLSKSIEQVSISLLKNGHHLAATYLLGEFVEAQPWLEGDYGSSDGFWNEHTHIANILFQLGKSLPKELIPEQFDPEASYLTLNVGIALNEIISIESLIKLIPSAANYQHFSEEEDAVLLATLLLNKCIDSEVSRHLVPQFSQLQAATICGLITGVYHIWGCSTESLQSAVTNEKLSEDMLRHIYELPCASEVVFNAQVNWNDLQVDSAQVKAEIAKRISL